MRCAIILVILLLVIPLASARGGHGSMYYEQYMASQNMTYVNYTAMNPILNEVPQPNSFDTKMQPILSPDIGNNTGIQGLQEPFQRDSIYLTKLPSWAPAGAITYQKMWGSPMYVKRTNSSQLFPPNGSYTITDVRPAVIRPSYVTRSMGRGSTFPIGTGGFGVTDTAVGRMQQCSRGSTKCVNRTFERCVGGFWVSTEQCKAAEVCTPNGCRIGRWSRFPSVRITPIIYPIAIGKTIGAAN